LGQKRTRSEISRQRTTRGGLTAFALFAIAGLHVAWGLGSSFPYRTREELADSVVGTEAMPSSTACWAVASVLVLAAMLVAGIVPLPGRFRGITLRIVAAVLMTRGIAGATGRTSTLVPGSDSPTFVRLDKSLFSPLCLWLAAGVRRSI
jgi:hypothetical protein